MNVKKIEPHEVESRSDAAAAIVTATVVAHLQAGERVTLSAAEPTLVFAASGSFILLTVKRDFYLTPETVVLLRSGQDVEIKCVASGELNTTTLAPSAPQTAFPSDLQLDIKLMAEVYDIVGAPYQVSTVGHLKLYFGDVAAGGAMAARLGDNCLSTVRHEPSRAPTACDVLVIGAGPIGLGIGASAANSNLNTVILGEPLSFWWHNILPQPLRSPLAASSIYISNDDYDIHSFCEDKNVGTEGVLRFPVFMAYAAATLGRYEHLIRAERVEKVRQTPAGWEVEVAAPFGAATYAAKSIVVATGLLPMAHIPSQVDQAGLGKTVQHSSWINRFDLLRPDINVIAVIGGGQSALEFALYAKRHGKRVFVVIREPELMFRNLHEPGHYWYKALAKRSEAITPWLPAALKSKLLAFLLKGTVEPRLREEILASGMEILANFRIADAEASGSGVTLRSEDGRALTVDRAIFGTGYNWTLDRLGLLDGVAQSIKREDGMPCLTEACESSLPGLFFAGYGAMRHVGFKSQFIQGGRLTTPAILRAILRRREGR